MMELIGLLADLVGTILYGVFIYPWIYDYEGNITLVVFGMGFSASMWFVAIGIPLGLYRNATIHSRPPCNTRIGFNPVIPRIEEIDRDTKETIDSRNWEMLCHIAKPGCISAIHRSSYYFDFLAVYQTDDGEFVQHIGYLNKPKIVWEYVTDISDMLDRVHEHIGQEAYDVVKEHARTAQQKARHKPLKKET